MTAAPLVSDCRVRKIDRVRKIEKVLYAAAGGNPHPPDYTSIERVLST